MSYPFIIQTQSLDYFFGSEHILKSLDLKVSKGTIHGFLGHNGAGKTTTIRLLLGLLKAMPNQVFLFDKDITKSRKEILRNVGALVEIPSLYPHLSAAENLEVTRRWLPWVGKSRINEVLEIVGLLGVANKKVSKFSLGMKQRLGLALTLLPDPELLILDEPTNGLDPTGIVEIRHLLKMLNRDLGKTVLVSSHLLSEVEKMASSVSIIHKGEMRFQGKIDELKEVYEKQSVVFEVDDAQAAQIILQSKGIRSKVATPQEISIPSCAPISIHQTNKVLVDSGLEVYQIHTQKQDLEELFMGLTGSEAAI